MSAKKLVGRKADIVVQELNGEVLVYDLDSHRALCLNQTSAVVWNACDGSRDVHEIREYASKQLKARVSDDLIWLALDQLKKEKLIEHVPATPSEFVGTSRRDVIKKIGLGTAVALPIIAGIIAPPATNAQSPGAGGLGACTGTCKCTSSGALGTNCTAQGGATCSAGCTNGCQHASTSNTNGVCA